MINHPYRALESRFRRLGLLQEASGFLSWDTDAMMPEGGAASRAEQQAALDVVCHELLTGPDLPDLFAAADAEAGLDPWQGANLREMRREWLHATAVPSDLVEASSRACSACEMAWRKARPANDYESVRPLLQTVLDLTRQIGQAKSAKLGVTPYEALLDQFEPGGRVAEIDPLFARLSEILPGLIEDALAFQGKRPAPLRPPGLSRSRRSARPATISWTSWDSISPMAGSMSASIPSPAARPTTCASPRATTKAISAAR